MKIDITQSNADPKVVLAKAFLNTAVQLGLKQTQLAAVIGVHRSTIGRLKTNPELDPATKQGELALLLVRVYHAVYVLSGGDLEWIHYFMNSYNKVTKGIPIEQIQSISGLVTVLNFVDALH
ncbi:helix-turn-helix domain-containing protein [Acinetobacter seifertii]|uniref:antitoxin Xre-like helix-turn-helix domain-containing protein n=1 Tax=Acinetobacter seifertii TaxID=1530123 RepID=UPI0018DE1329|nr:antitoxin Xre-like helix-turn-helix domain-containing protein [Acinetobacter seifertii]QPV59485.1 helix-turn-helix domain-containing protein [Acinetobacter seifertii]